jgi:hypothetical protein
VEGEAAALGFGRAGSKAAIVSSPTLCSETGERRHHNPVMGLILLCRTWPTQGAWMRLVSSRRHGRPVAGGIASAATFSRRQHGPVLGLIWAQWAMPCGSSCKSLVDDVVQWPHSKSALFAHHRKGPVVVGLSSLLCSSKLVAWGLLGLNNEGGPQALFAQK